MNNRTHAPTRLPRRSILAAAAGMFRRKNCIRHGYKGHNYIGHAHISRDYAGHKHIDHNSETDFYKERSVRMLPQRRARHGRAEAERCAVALGRWDEP